MLLGNYILLHYWTISLDDHKNMPSVEKMLPNRINRNWPEGTEELWPSPAKEAAIMMCHDVSVINFNEHTRPGIENQHLR